MGYQKIYFTALLFFTTPFFALSQNNKPPVHYDACKVSNNLSGLLKPNILRDVIKKSSDKCNFRLVDSIFFNYLNRKDTTSYNYIALLCSVSDGYLTDYIIEQMSLIWRQDFHIFFDHLYNEFKRTRNNRVSDILIQYWGSKASLSINPVEEKRKIEEYARKIVIIPKGQSQSEDKKKYLNSLLNKIDINYLD